MHRCSRLGLPAPLLLCAVGTFGLLSMTGCILPPDRVFWKSEDRTVQPQADGARGSGRLIVDTVYLGIDDGLERRERYYLYDDQGRYLTYYNNDRIAEISLPAGRYMVVSSVGFTNRKVQILIRDGMTTRVTLDDLKSAPDAAAGSP